MATTLPQPRNTLELLGELDLQEQVNDLLRSIATRTTDDRVTGWADRAVREAQDAAKRRLDGMDEEIVLAGLRPLARVTPQIGRLGVKRMRAGLTAMHAGDPAKADAAFLALEGLSYEERRKALRDATHNVVAEEDQTRKDLADLKRAIVAAGAEAFKAAIPFLLASLTRS